MEATLDPIRQELRKEKVQLWSPPYHKAEGSEEALASLAAQYARHLGLGESAVLESLRELQAHALAKLEAKNQVKLEGRVLGAATASTHTATFQTSDMGFKVRSALCERLGMPGLKVIAGGRALQDDRTLLDQGWASDSARGGKPLRVLLIAAVQAAAAGVRGGAEAGGAPAATPAVAKDPVVSIRDAAARLTRDGFGDFELTDAASGRLVPVPPQARQALIAAIVLHSKGREVLQGGADNAGRALAFLTEADGAFEQCRSAGGGQLLGQLDNFGYLQLDMCWAYALLGDSEHLPDAERRLSLAEAALLRKYDRNFLALAEVQAERGRTLTPDVVPLVRLWLLRGMARHYRGEQGGAKADLERAALFAAALRVDDVAVTSLLLMGATRTQAVAALRRAEGNADRAAADWMDGEKQRSAAKKERDEQRHLGHTADGAYVDATRVGQLTSMGIDRKLAIEALRQANNDLEAALEAVQTQPAEVLLRKRHKTEEAPAPPVDEIALASMLSMGFDRTSAEEALRASSGDLEEAIGLASTGVTAAPDAATDVPAAAPHTSAAPASAASSAAVGSDAASEADAKEEERGRAAAYEEARELIEHELGGALRRTDLDEEVAGASLDEEELLLQQFGLHQP
mmetsp:Transcript_102556/g.290040  ORF Transcript_102556/g.290040 Transcript_102556/m.290040 type:complete len:632 (+) Transcript_102556:57-1952(+)